jgi:3-hydroxyisobutyrate dehydrogenase-like beta-hydroxyacid dehydrogenase
MAKVVGVLGLGNIGRGMCECLLEEDFEVVGYDPSSDATERARQMGARIAGSANDLAAQVPVVVSSLPDPRTVVDAWSGEAGLLAGPVAGSTLIETSTIDPHTMRNVARDAQARGADVLDVTLSGEPAQAAKGELVFMVGGDEATLAANRFLLETLSRQIHYTGPIGTAKTVKLVNNLMSLSNIAAASEAFVLGVKCGMEPQRLYDILSTSGGRSAHFNYDFPKVLQGDYRPGFKTSLALKDIRLILDLARQEQYVPVVAPVIAQLYESAVDNGSGDDHFTSLVKLYEANAGISVQLMTASAGG